MLKLVCQKPKLQGQPTKKILVTKCLFLGFSENTTAYLLQNIIIRNIFVSRIVSLNENNLPSFRNETEGIDNSFLYLDID